MKELTLVLLKPDAIERHLVGRIIQRFEEVGLKIVAMKLLTVKKELAEEHYDKDIEDKHGKSVRDGLIDYIKDSPILGFLLEGVDAINVVRKIVGSTYPNEALPGTIRGDFAHISKEFANTTGVRVRNLIHASANLKDANREIPLWFNPDEIQSYKTSHEIFSLEES